MFLPREKKIIVKYEALPIEGGKDLYREKMLGQENIKPLLAGTSMTIILPLTSYTIVVILSLLYLS